MEKDSGQYRYEPYPIVAKEGVAKSDTPAPTTERDGGGGCCRCFGNKSKRNAFCTGLATNLGICVLLFGYTLIGSVIFLTIEGGIRERQHTTLATTASMAGPKTRFNQSAHIKAKTDEARARTVETIWDITFTLNILYRDNWTRLAAQEINKFQEELMRQLEEEYGEGRAMEPTATKIGTDGFQWTFARAFLYSLTVLTTIGYGSIAPKTTAGKAVTVGYALIGIPLTLLYLSSIGSILSHVARGVFSRALCCCLCSNCGYCCYDERRMAEKERRMRKKRQQMEMQQQLSLQEPFYVRSGGLANNVHEKELDSGSGTDNESKASMHGLSILAPVLLCLVMMFLYICLGTFALFKLENWHVVDGFYFCFMSLTTIGFGDMVPGLTDATEPDSELTVWFCSVYIMCGMALTAMCFNVVHDEIIHRLRHQDMRMKLGVPFGDDVAGADPYHLPS